MNLPHDKKIAVIVVHGWTLPDNPFVPVGQNYFDEIATRAALLKTADVRELHWEEKAGITPFKESGVFNSKGILGPGIEKAQRMGRCLAQALAGYEFVHLIGHSLGSWVIDAAADQLTWKGVNTHLTFLDAYVPNSGYAGALGDNATFAEQFVSRPIDGRVLHTNELLSDAHNFDVSDPGHTGFAEHGWPIEWYAKSTSPGFNDTWEAGGFKGHGTYPENSRPTCLGSQGCVSSKSDYPSGDLPQVGGIGIPAGDGSIRLQAKSGSSASQRLSVGLSSEAADQSTESTASVTVRLPRPALSVSAEASIGVVGDGGGSIEIRLGPGEPVTVSFGAEGFEGDLYAIVGQSRTGSDVQLTLRATGNATVTAVITTVTAYGVGGGTAPLPPNTGNVAAAATDQNAQIALKAAVLIALFFGLTGGSLFALRRR